MRLRYTLPVFSLLLISTAPSVVADQCSPPKVGTPVVPGIGELDIDSSSVDGGTLGQAIGDWKPCPQFGKGFPTLVPNGKGGFPVTVNLHAGTSWSPGGRCGLTSASYSGGKPTSLVIDLWSQQGNGATCYPQYDNLAHEIGHVLGLGDAPAGCNGRIMGTPAGPGQARTVGPADCSEADQMWKTPAELAPPPPPPSQCPPDCICPPTCQSGCDANGVCQDNTCSTDPTAPGCGGDGPIGGGGSGDCGADNPCDDGGGGGVIIVPPPSPPPPRPGAALTLRGLVAGQLAARACSQRPLPHFAARVREGA